VALNVGKTIFDFSENPPQLIFEAGRHEFAAQLCPLLDQ
jgi:hypothetical protein